MRKTRRTSAGDDLIARCARLFAAVVLIGCLNPSGLATPADKKQNPSYALIAGTVFRDDGFTLPGAEILITPVGDSRQARNIKKMEASSDARGEFAVRVPPVPMEYSIIVKARGYLQQEKRVTISAEERIDVFFRLEPASKK